MTKRFFSFAVVISFFLGCTDIPDDLRQEAEGKCNGRSYTEYQFCAGGKIYDFCSGTPYNPSVVACCNNHQYTLPTEFCSGSYIYRRCGGKEYNLDTQFCNGSDVLSKCGGSTYNPASYFCYGNQSYPLCGDSKQSYNPSTQTCQSGVIQSKCGSSWYSPSTQFCYNDRSYSLCGGRSYNPDTQQCQSGVVQGKCGTSWYDSATQFCSGADSKIYSLCGGKEYNTSNQRCQGNVVETRCGSGWYNVSNSNQRCQSNVVETQCGGNWYALNSNQRCQSNVVETQCGGNWYALNSNQRCNSNVVETRCGNGWYDVSNSNQRCQSNVVETRCGNGWYDASTQYCSNGTSKNYGSVTYENKTYKTVVIGTQTWMAENLNYNVTGSICYGDYDGRDNPNCAKYGRLYNWATAMDINSSFNSSSYNPSSSTKYRGVCPGGWHIPNNAEWDKLVRYVDGTSGTSSPYISPTAGRYLKAANGWNDNNGSSGGGTDEFGFSALPGGFGSSDGRFYDVGLHGFWWSASEYGSYDAYYRDMSYGSESVIYNYVGKDYLFSVRCVQD